MACLVHDRGVLETTERSHDNVYRLREPVPLDSGDIARAIKLDAMRRRGNALELYPDRQVRRGQIVRSERDPPLPDSPATVAHGAAVLRPASAGRATYPYHCHTSFSPSATVASVRVKTSSSLARPASVVTGSSSTRQYVDPIPVAAGAREGPRGLSAEKTDI